MDNPVPYKDYLRKRVTCLGCKAHHRLRTGDAQLVSFHGYKGFGMVANWAELSIPCNACGSEIRFEVNHEAAINIGRMFPCRTCQRFFDHGLSHDDVRTLVRNAESRDIPCPNCAAGNHYDFPACLGVYAADYAQ